MRKIGNIITDSKFEGNGLYNVVHSIDGCIDDIPTLIVGWENAKSLYPGLDILDCHIKGNVYWTFGKRERNWCYEDNVIKFKKLCLDYIIQDIKYVFFNLLTATKEEKRKLITLIKDPRYMKYVYFRNNMAYIYIEEKKMIYGLSLRDIEYAGGKYEKFMGMLRGINTVTIVKPDKESFDLRELIQTKSYIVPYLYSK